MPQSWLPVCKIRRETPGLSQSWPVDCMNAVCNFEQIFLSFGSICFLLCRNVTTGQQVVAYELATRVYFAKCPTPLYHGGLDLCLCWHRIGGPVLLHGFERKVRPTDTPHPFLAMNLSPPQSIIGEIRQRDGGDWGFECNFWNLFFLRQTKCST